MPSLDAKDLFTNPAFGIGRVFGQVLQVFCAEWQTFMMLSFLQFAALIPFTILVVLIFLSIFYVQTMNAINAVHTGDATRMLADTFNNNNSFGDGTTVDITAGFITTFIFLYIALLVVYVCVASTFRGAVITSVADIYAGQTPSWKRAIRIGWNNVCRMICFGLLVGLGSGLVTFCVIFIFYIPLALSRNNNGGGLYILFLFLGYIVLFTILFYIFTVMITGPSSIIVEQLSPRQAITTSWERSRGHVCFLFCSIFCFQMMELVARFLLNLILGAIVNATGAKNVGVFVLVLSSMIVALAIVPLNMIIETVLYFALRITNEGFTQSMLIRDHVNESNKLGTASYLHATNDDDDEAEGSAVELKKEIV